MLPELFLVIVISLSLIFFYLVFKFSYQITHAIFNAGESSASFFS